MMGIVVFAGCGRQVLDSQEVLEDRISEYLPITLHDQFVLTSGWYEQRRRARFDEPSLAVIYQALSNFVPLEGRLPWEDDPTLALVGGPTRLNVTNANHTIKIGFVLHSYLNMAFAHVQINDTTEQWFTFNLDYGSALFDLLP